MSTDTQTCGKGPSPDGMVFVKSYTNRWGQEMRAEDHGLKAFVFFIKKKKPPKN